MPLNTQIAGILHELTSNMLLLAELEPTAGQTWSELCFSCAGEAEELRRQSIGARPSDAGQPTRLSLGSRPEACAGQGTADESLSRPQDGISSSGADVSMPALQPISVERIPSASLIRSGAPPVALVQRL